MKDKLVKRRIVVDYKNLIKGQGLWYVFKKFAKEKQRKIKSKKRLMYLFCTRYLAKEIVAIKEYYYSLSENIRLAQDHSWIEEE